MNEIRAKSEHTEKRIELETLNAEIRSLCGQGDYDRALVVAKKALEVAEENMSPDHPDLATQLDVFAELYHTTFFEYEPAEPLYKRSLDIREKALGPDHPDVARDLDIMAALYRETKREEAAVELEKRAADIRAIKR
jgi:tetratricopeptide (TPR) repeat protein